MIIVQVMVREEIVKIVNTFLEEEFEVESQLMTEDALLKDDLGIDSLDFVDIAVEVEKQFGFKITPEQMKSVATLGEFYELIVNKQNN